MPLLLRLLASCLLAALSACSALPGDAPQPKDPSEALPLAKGMLEQQRPAAAYAILQIFEKKGLNLPQQATWHQLVALSLLRQGELSEAHESYRRFLDANPYIPDSQPLWDLNYEIGAALLRRNSGYWVFYQDSRQGKNILEDLITKSPRHERRADTLHLLGELAYQEADYELARERFGAILTGYAQSEWATKAGFRVAMSYYRRLLGPAYDLEEMSKARVELRDFLQTDVENPRYRSEASAALTQVEEWLAQKHVRIADFYRTLDNRRGEIEHLRLSAEDFPQTKAGEAARKRLAALQNGAPQPGNFQPGNFQPGNPKR